MRCERIAARVEGDRQSEGIMSFVLGQLEAMRGNFERGRELYRRAHATFEELRLQVDAATVSLSSGHIERLAGDVAAAERELRRGYDELTRLGERYLLSSVTGYLAEAVVAQGRLDEAEALAQETAELAGEDDVDAQMLWRLTRARVCALRGELEDARSLSSEAVRLVEPTDDLVNKANAYACHAWVLALAGREHNARDFLQQARAFAAEKGSPVMVARVDELGAELAHLSVQAPAPVKAPDPV